jgi:hypothetical protein
MANSTPTTSESGGSFWGLVNKLIGLFLVLFAGFWGGAFVIGGIAASKKKHGPVEVAAPAPAAVAAAVAPAAPVAAGPAQELTLKPDAVNPMAFNAKAFTVKAGQPVKLTFDNAAAVPLPPVALVPVEAAPPVPLVSSPQPAVNCAATNEARLTAKKRRPTAIMACSRGSSGWGS